MCRSWRSGANKTERIRWCGHMLDNYCINLRVGNIKISSLAFISIRPVDGVWLLTFYWRATNEMITFCWDYLTIYPEYFNEKNRYSLRTSTNLILWFVADVITVVKIKKGTDFNLIATFKEEEFLWVRLVMKLLPDFCRFEENLQFYWKLQYYKMKLHENYI